jgi:hypothetical protein
MHGRLSDGSIAQFCRHQPRDDLRNRRSASHTQACDAAITVTPNSRSSASMASITGQCGEGKKIASACGCARISARHRSHRDAAEVFDELAASHDAEHLAAVAFGVGDRSRVLMGAVRVCHHHLLAAEHLRRLRLRGDA